MNEPIVTAAEMKTLLTHIRNAMLANKCGASPGRALEAAEETVLNMLFSKTEVEEYLASEGAKVYR